MKRAAGQVTVSEQNGSARVTLPSQVREILGDPDEVVWFIDADKEITVLPAEEVAPR